MFKLLLLIFSIFFSLKTSASIFSPEVVKEVKQRVIHQYNPGIVIAYFDGYQVDYLIEGYANLAQRKPLTKDTVFEIGSITKTMTSLLLADAVIKGELILDQPITSLWPDIASQQVSHQITLKQLATHTSGLPRLPSNLTTLGNFIGLVRNDPYAFYDRDDLVGALSKQKVDANAGYSYSNYGAGLLGELLAIHYGLSYEQLIQQRVFNPLGMTQSYADSAQVPSDLKATGYAGDDEVSSWHFKALAGAGAVNTNIKDLMTYGLAILHADNDQLKEAIKLSKQIHYQSKKLTLGLGWHFSKNALWHNGGTGGFRSILIIDPEQNKVVAGITNQSEHNIEDIVKHILWPEKSFRTYDYPVNIEISALKVYEG